MSNSNAVPENVFEHLRKTHFILTVTCGALLYVAWAAAPTWMDNSKLRDIQRFGQLVERYLSYAGSEGGTNGLCSRVMTREVAAAEQERFRNDLAATVASLRRTSLLGEGAPSARSWSSAEPPPDITGGALATPKVDCASLSVPRTVGQLRQAWNEARMTVKVSVPELPRGPQLIDVLTRALPGAEFSQTAPGLRAIGQLQENGRAVVRLLVEHNGVLKPVDVPVAKEDRSVDLRATLCGDEPGLRSASHCEVDVLERMFPFAMELASQSDHVALADFKRVVAEQVEKGPPAIKLFDNEVSGRNVRLVGVLVVLAIQLYQLAHVQHFHAGRTLACGSVAWIALYPTPIGRTLTLLTMWVIPALTVGMLAFTPGSDWMQVPLLALIVFATSMIAGWFTLVHLVPRATLAPAAQSG